MKRCSKNTWLTFVLVTVAGACLHFGSSLWPNLLTQLLCPIQESIWEHLKILFWPGLLSVLILSRGDDSRTSRMAALLLSCVLMLASGWVLHIVLKVAPVFADALLYVLLMALCLFLPCLAEQPLRHLPALPVFALVILLAAAILIFSFVLPKNILFLDLSGVNTWATIPY